jgi:hypothetical protein
MSNLTTEERLGLRKLLDRQYPGGARITKIWIPNKGMIRL